MISLRPANGVFFQTCNLGKSIRQDLSLVCFGNLDPFFKVTGEFSLKICLEPVDGCHLT